MTPAEIAAAAIRAADRIEREAQPGKVHIIALVAVALRAFADEIEHATRHGKRIRERERIAEWIRELGDDAMRGRKPVTFAELADAIERGNHHTGAGAGEDTSASACICCDLDPPYRGMHHDTRCPLYARPAPGPLATLQRLATLARLCTCTGAPKGEPTYRGIPGNHHDTTCPLARPFAADEIAEREAARARDPGHGLGGPVWWHGTHGGTGSTGHLAEHCTCGASERSLREHARVPHIPPCPLAADEPYCTCTPHRTHAPSYAHAPGCPLHRPP